LYLALSTLFRTWQDYRQSEAPIVQSFQIGVIAMMAAFLVREFADNTLRNAVVMIYFWIFIALVRNITLLYADRTSSGKLKIKIQRYD